MPRETCCQFRPSIPEPDPTPSGRCGPSPVWRPRVTETEDTHIPVAFCTTCKDRLQHIERTLPHNLMMNRGSGYGTKVVLLDYGSPDGLTEYLKANHQRDIDDGSLVVYGFPEAGPFKMAHAKNMSHRLAMREGCDILVNIDADNFTGPQFGEYVADQFVLSNEEIFLWSRMIKDGAGRLPRGISGRIAVTAKAFTKTGGYDERFEAWSPDDKDFNLRLTRFGYQAREIDPRYLIAILHNDKMRFKGYTGDQLQAADMSDFETVSSRLETIANYGRMGLGTVYRNFFPDPIEIKPLPTRIFGIGMHKTATTSLHHALELLGYDSAHWPSAHWAKGVYEEMITWKRSNLLERYHAACDLPIPLLFRELDQAYPGSKFILTIRDENRWAESVRKHFSAANKFRGAWDRDPFTHRVHNLVYGRKTYDREIFLTRYRQHNREVREYFRSRGRERDLLVMNMDAGDGWPELCGFLDRPIVPFKYPWAYASAEKEDTTNERGADPAAEPV